MRIRERFCRYPLEYCFKVGQHYGMDGVEVWGARPHAYAYDLDAGRVAEINGYKKKYGLEISMFTPEILAYPYNLASQEKKEYEETVAYLIRSVEAAAAIGTDQMQKLCIRDSILLDPLFLFVLGLGVRGAAIATVISQAASALWAVCFLRGKRALLRLKVSSMRLQLPLVREICFLGASGFIMSVTNSAVQIVCNATLQSFGGDLYVGVMTIINSIREIATTAVNGLTSACLLYTSRCV